jgi:hypothetical protein
VHSTDNIHFVIYVYVTCLDHPRLRSPNELTFDRSNGGGRRNSPVSARERGPDGRASDREGTTAGSGADDGGTVDVGAVEGGGGGGGAMWVGESVGLAVARCTGAGCAYVNCVDVCLRFDRTGRGTAFVRGQSPSGGGVGGKSFIRTEGSPR